MWEALKKPYTENPWKRKITQKFVLERKTHTSLGTLLSLLLDGK